MKVKKKREGEKWWCGLGSVYTVSANTTSHASHSATHVRINSLKPITVVESLHVGKYVDAFYIFWR